MQIPISIDVHHEATLQSQVVAQLRTLILSKRLKPGSLVPTTRDLARQLGVSRNTISGAYEVLVSEGYLYTERTVGTFVCATLPDELLRPTECVTPARTGTLYRALNLPLPYS